MTTRQRARQRYSGCDGYRKTSEGLRPCREAIEPGDLYVKAVALPWLTDAPVPTFWTLRWHDGCVAP